MTPIDAFFGAAQSFLEGTRILARAQPVPSLPLTVVAGHALECALKAFLAKSGLTEQELSKDPFSHDVGTLWQEAQKRGLALPSPTPDWVSQLARVYDRPFVARYPMGVHGVVLPNIVALAAGVDHVVETVRAALT